LDRCIGWPALLQPQTNWSLSQELSNFSMTMGRCIWIGTLLKYDCSAQYS
jgi:hypothetical protein